MESFISQHTERMLRSSQQHKHQGAPKDHGQRMWSCDRQLLCLILCHEECAIVLEVGENPRSIMGCSDLSVFCWSQRSDMLRNMICWPLSQCSGVFPSAFPRLMMVAHEPPVQVSEKTSLDPSVLSYLGSRLYVGFKELSLPLRHWCWCLLTPLPESVAVILSHPACWWACSGRPALYIFLYLSN
jgi:hypothetical protein